MSNSTYIYDAVRTPRGKAKADAALAQLSPQELVGQLHSALKERNEGALDNPDSLLLGCVGQFGSQGGNIALVSKLHAGMPDSASASSLNNYCASGLTAIGQAFESVASGNATAVLAGGVEMMSQVPFMADKASYYDDDSFPARTRYIPVVLAADRLAQQEGITRQQLDETALASQQKATAAQISGSFQKSRIAIKNSDGSVALDQDECVRGKTTAESLASMAPGFGELAKHYAGALGDERFDPIHTISHAPPICDGAGLALVGGAGLGGGEPRARILAFADCGADPAAALTAGFASMERALERAGLSLQQIDRIEFMEAFGVTIAKFLRDYPVDPDKVNVSGGHIAKGHPLGASGAILISSLLDCLDEADQNIGMVVVSGASGSGGAMIVERLG